MTMTARLRCVLIAGTTALSWESVSAEDFCGRLIFRPGSGYVLVTASATYKLMVPESKLLVGKLTEFVGQNVIVHGDRVALSMPDQPSAGIAGDFQMEAAGGRSLCR